MTVCIAAMFTWNYASAEQPQLGKGIITLSDRMITAGDVEYEPQQLKIAHITPHVMILVAGDYTVHSQALIGTHKQVKADSSTSTQAVANIYSQSLQTVLQRQAEDIILAPLGLNTESFLTQQKDYSDRFVERITAQLQGFEGPDVEALVVGTEGFVSHIFQIDKYGTVRCYDDVGFAAIGIGGWHARSQLMQSGYTNTSIFAPALAATFAAKKAAEIAPGIGEETDVWLSLKDAKFPIWPKVDAKLKSLYAEYSSKRTELGANSIIQLQAFIDDPENWKTDAIPEKIDGGGDREAEG